MFCAAFCFLNPDANFDKFFDIIKSAKAGRN